MALRADPCRAGGLGPPGGEERVCNRSARDVLAQYGTVTAAGRWGARGAGLLEETPQGQDAPTRLNVHRYCGTYDK